MLANFAHLECAACCGCASWEGAFWGWLPMQFDHWTSAWLEENWCLQPHLFFFTQYQKNLKKWAPHVPRHSSSSSGPFLVAPRFWPKGAACNSLNQYTCATLLLAIYKRIVMWFGKRDLSRLPTQASGQFGLSYLMLLGCGFVCKGPDFTRYKLNVLSFFFFLNVSFKNKIMI